MLYPGQLSATQRIPAGAVELATQRGVGGIQIGVGLLLDFVQAVQTVEIVMRLVTGGIREGWPGRKENESKNVLF